MKKRLLVSLRQKVRASLFILMFLSSLSLFAQSGITINVINRPLKAVIETISNQSNYRFVYTSELKIEQFTVTVNSKDEPITTLLDKIFKPINVKYQQKGSQIVLGTTTQNALKVRDEKPIKKISGRINDESGVPLIGIAIKNENSKAISVSDLEGNYEIEAKEGDKLSFSLIGMETFYTTVGKDAVVNVPMRTDAIALKNVVVTGYQTISKERSAGSYAIVGSAEFQDKSIARGSLLEGLEGMLAGFRINLGAEGDKFLVRGITSINSNRKPLFIVDGVSIPLDMIESTLNGNDVKNVTVLKDATAASIWGAQAANGVVVITTKNGNRNDRIDISYNGSFTYKGMPDYSYNDMMNSSMFIKNASEEFDPIGYPWSSISTNINYAVLPHEIPLYKHYLGEISKSECDAQLKRLSELNGRKDYEKYMMSNSWLTNHSMSLSGGNKIQTFYVSMGYQGGQNDSKARTNEYRINAKENIDITKWMNLDLTLNASYTTNKTNLNQFSFDDIPGAIGLTNLPYAVFHDKDGNPLSFTNYLINQNLRTSAQNLTGINLDYYPIADFNNTTQESILSNIRTNAGLTIKILDGLNYEGRFSYYISNGKSETYTPQESYNVRLDRVYATTKDGISYLPSSGGYFRAYNSQEDSYTVRNQLSYDKSFKNGLHQVTALLGQEVNNTKSGNNSSLMRGYDKQTMQNIFYDDYYINVEGVEKPVLNKVGNNRNYFSPNSYNQGETTYRFVSFYANTAYTYNKRYSLNASIRVDQSNLFGSDPSIQFKPIWSIGGVWNINREKFMENTTWINDLNIRASYGFSGNSPSPGQGGPYNIINATSDPSYSEFGLGYIIATPANDKLTWEKTRTWNFGTSFSLFSNKLSGSFDIYNKKTTDLLAMNPVNPSTGYTSVFQNIGEMNNKGFEVSLSSRNISNQNFSWNTDLILSYNKNRIVKMYFPAPLSPASYVNEEYAEGYPASALFAYKWAGLDPVDGAARVYDSQGNIVRKTEDIKDISAIAYKGTTVPPWSGSMTNIIRYKDLELSFMFVANLGHKMRNDTYTQTDYRFAYNIHNDFDKRWRKPGDEKLTNIPSFYKMADADERDGGYLFPIYSDINILDASYIKLRDLSVSYYLPKNLCQGICAKSLKVRVQASNLLTIGFNKEGIDPEAFSLRNGARYDRYKPSISASLLIEF